MTTREACGNSVRNITACPYSGVAEDEAFDVTPYAEALTRYLLRHPLSSVAAAQVQDRVRRLLATITSASAINDIGWNARVQTVGGRDSPRLQGHGRGRHGDDDPGRKPAARVPAGRVRCSTVAEAIIRVFHRLGDYKHKQKNRLKFLVKSLGWDGFAPSTSASAPAFGAEHGAALPFDPERPPVEEAPTWPRAPRAGARRDRRRARPPRPSSARASCRRSSRGCRCIQPEFRRVVAHERAAAEAGRLCRSSSSRRVLGDLTSAQMRLIGELSAAYRRRHRPRDDGPESGVPLGPNQRRRAVLQEPGGGGPGAAGRRHAADVTSCPGAESCKLAVTQSRGLGRVLARPPAGAPGSRRRARRAWTSRSAAARTAAASTTSPASASRAA